MESYSLKQLLQRYMVVPEIQREYVWGRRPEIYKQFIDTLSQTEGDVNVGFLYTYERNGENYIIDGQQRFTTLVLLLYVLAQQSPQTRTAFRTLLRVDEPLLAFSYRVRASTEQFMKQLFESGLTASRQIRDSHWYAPYYEEDVTIKSMLQFLDFMHEPTGFHLAYQDVLERVHFWYYPVDKTSLGEELYITMNSRGQSLDESDQLKPLLFRQAKERQGETEAYAQNWGKVWDDWENFIFHNLIAEQQVEQVNIAMNNFLRLIWDLETCQEHDELVPSEAIAVLNLPLIQTYFQALDCLVKSPWAEVAREPKRLAGNGTDFRKNDARFQLLKSLLSSVLNFKPDSYELKRVYETVYNLLHRLRHLRHISLLKTLQSYRQQAGTKSFYQVVIDASQAVDEQNPVWSDQRELKIVRLLSAELQTSAVEGFLPVELSVWGTCSMKNMPQHHIWEGDMSVLIDWSTDEEGKFSLDRFNHYAGLIDQLFDTNDHHTLDALRRAWIVGKSDYAPFERGKYSTFGWEWSEWFTMMHDSADEFRQMLDKVVALKGTGQRWDDALEAYIAQAPVPDKKYMEFAVTPYLLSFTHTSDCCDLFYNWSHREWWICTKGGVGRHTKFISVPHAHLLQAFGGNARHRDGCTSGVSLGFGDWRVWYWDASDGNCIAVESSSKNLVVDIRYNAAQRSCWLILKPRSGTCPMREICPIPNGFTDKDGEYHLHFNQEHFDPQAIRLSVMKLIQHIEQE